MKRNNGWISRWAGFLTGICIGLLIVAPVLAFAQLPFADNTASMPQWLESARSLFDIVAILLSVAAIRHLATASPARQKSR